MKKNKGVKQIILFLIIVFIGITVLANMIKESGFMDGGITTSTFKIISSTENKDVEISLNVKNKVIAYARQVIMMAERGIKIPFYDIIEMKNILLKN